MQIKSSAMILEPKKIKSVTVSIVSPSLFHKVMGLDAIFVFWLLNFKPAFSTLLFQLHQEALWSLFAFCHKGGVICIWGYSYFSRQSWFQLVLHPAWHFSWCILHISTVTIYSLVVVLLSQFETSPLFHVRFKLLVLNLHTGFSGGR